MDQDTCISVVNTNNLDILDTGAKIAAIVTLALAVGTYWYNFIKQKSTIRNLRKHLTTELRGLLYNSVTPNILAYDKSAKADYGITPSFKATKNPTMKAIDKSGQLYKILTNAESVVCFYGIMSLIELTEESLSTFLNKTIYTTHSRKEFFDFFLEHRLFELRQRILELSQIVPFIDMGIMPKKFVGHLPQIEKIKESVLGKLKKDVAMQQASNEIVGFETMKQIDRYRYVQEEQKLIVQVLQKYIPGKSMWLIPEQYFGEED